MELSRDDQLRLKLANNRIEVCSRLGGLSLQRVVKFPKLTPHQPIPRPFERVHDDPTEATSKETCRFEYYHDVEANIIYINLVSSRDVSELLNQIQQSNWNQRTTTELHHWFYEREHEELRYMLHMFFICHVILIYNAFTRVEFEWLRILRTLQAWKTVLSPVVIDYLDNTLAPTLPDNQQEMLKSTACPGRVCPILAFVFDDTAILPLKEAKLVELETGEWAILPPDSNMQHINTQMKLQQALETQVRTLLKKPKYSSASSQVESVKLYQLDISHAAHIVTVGEMQNAHYFSEPEISATAASSLEKLRAWLTSKYESLAANTSNILPTSKYWFATAQLLQEIIISGKHLPAELQNSTLPSLRNLVDPDWFYSSELCNHAVPLAKMAYYHELPQQYTKSFHDKRIAIVKKIFRCCGRGPAVESLLQQVILECEAYWNNGHRKCDAISVTNRPCIYQYHSIPSESGATTDAMAHSSGYRSFHACNCGKTRRIREDEFDLASANSEFFKADCCSSLPSLLDSGTRVVASSAYMAGEESDTSSPAPQTKPAISHWAVTVLGPASMYNPEKGLQQDGFLAGYNQLLQWDIVLSSHSKRAKAAPQAEEPAHEDEDAKVARRPRFVPKKRPSEIQGQRDSLTGYIDKALHQKEVRRAYIGFEYECPLGHRFFLNADILATVLGLKVFVKAGKVSLSKLINEVDLGLYLICPCGRNSLAQLQRIYFVTPTLSGSSGPRIVINPAIKFVSTLPSAPVEKFAFALGREIVLPEASLVCLRLPYIFSPSPGRYLTQRHPTSPWRGGLHSKSIRVV